MKMDIDMAIIIIDTFMGVNKADGATIDAYNLIKAYAETEAKAEKRKAERAKPKCEKFIDKVFAENHKAYGTTGGIREQFQAVYKNADGKHYVCMLGYLAAQVPAQYAEDRKIINEGDNEFVNFAKFIDDAELVKGETPLDKPSEIELKELIKAKKNYDFGDGLPYVDAKYLLLILSHFPSIDIYPVRTTAFSEDFSNIYFESCDVRGLLMGLRRR